MPVIKRRKKSYGQKVALALGELLPNVGDVVSVAELAAVLSQTYDGTTAHHSYRRWYIRIAQVFPSSGPRWSYLEGYERGYLPNGYLAIRRRHHGITDEKTSETSQQKPMQGEAYLDTE